MHSKVYKICELYIKIKTPEELSDDGSYGLFVSKEEKADATAEFYFVDSLPSPKGRLIARSLESLTYDNDGEIECFYREGEGYYALRRTSGLLSKIYLPSCYKNKLWTRVAFTLLGIEELSAAHNMAIMHASFIKYKGRAILFTAPTETGKSTQAELWRLNADSEIINGDKAMLYFKDRALVGGLPYCGSSKICKNEILPIGAIVRLGQAKENQLTRLYDMQAFSAVFKGLYRPARPELNASIMELSQKISAEVPVFWLDCVPDKTAVEILKREIDSLWD